MMRASPSALSYFSTAKTFQLRSPEPETVLRLRIYCSENCPHTLIQDLRAVCRVEVDLLPNLSQLAVIEVELRGKIPSLQHSLSYLQSLKLRIQGRPQPDGDSWHC